MKSVLRVVAGMRLLFFPGLLRKFYRARFYLEVDGDRNVRDPLPFFSSELYLLRGLGLRPRIEAYIYHREFEEINWSEDYSDLVYAGTGLTLWERVVDGAAFILRLERSEERDRNEGELSIVLTVDGDVCCRLSFSYVPVQIFTEDHVESGTDEPSGRTAMLVGRSQVLASRGRDTFLRVLPNESARMYTLAGLSGIALAAGFDRVRGINEALQVGYKSDLAEGFRKSYSDVWVDLPGAVRMTDYTSFSAVFPATADAPIQAKNRSRARRRRKNWDSIRDEVLSTVSPHRAN